MARGLLIVVSGPSGVGKSTVIDETLKEEGVVPSVSCTTRKPRPGEKEGDEYFFLTRDEFMKKVQTGEMAEYAEVFGNLYGTPRKHLLDCLAAGKDVITDVDVQGAKQLKKSFPDAVMIFLAPPSQESLEKRLHQRKTDDAATIKKRLDTAEREMAEMDMYEYVVINNVLADAAGMISAIRRAEHAKRKRVKEEYRW